MLRNCTDQHNHFAHSALTRYALGAPPKLLEDVWTYDRQHLVSIDPKSGDHKVQFEHVPEKPITSGNWDDPQYLGRKE
jgi:hypothetical protein